LLEAFTRETSMEYLMFPLVTCFINRKGGCGKSSCTFHLAGTFASAGRRVLLLDLDPQASLSQGIFGPAAVEAMPPSATVAGLFDDKVDPDPEKLICPTSIKNISILPGSNAMEAINYPNPHETGELQTAVRAFVKEAKSAYDLVLIDCPPTLALCSWNAVLASDFVVVPLQPEDYGSQGITYIQRFVDQALAKNNPALKLLGYLLTMVQPRLGIHTAYSGQLRQLYGDQVFANAVPMAAHYKESIAARQPISHYKPKAAAGKAIKAVAEEMLHRAERLVGQPAGFLYLGNRVGPKEIQQEVA
jgi:chromosome partitioning protein